MCATQLTTNFDGVWVIEHIDPNIRFEMQGEYVRANEPVLIKHFHTNVCLAADSEAKYANDFGTEYEVYCNDHSRNNRS